ncbi:MAG: CmcJ/NvfI family oxidoreductase [Candidatus Binatus sp.]|uniref:CmcJ/NvfI family oxidoreductase n=1 Tax=Candidatus Binatus sp. TaxID=2811406 RepID=UPI003BB056E7
MGSAIENDLLEDFSHIEGSLLYLVDPAETRGTTEIDEPLPDPSQWPGRSRRYTISIRDGRPIIAELSQDKQGFVLVRHQTAVSNFYDEAEVRAVYYPEVERLLKQATGATKILVFAHDVRSARQAREKGVREPVAAVHNDYTIKSGPQHVRELLEPGEAEERLKNRFAEINVWRPIRGPVQGTPLAVCDSRSIAPKDLVPTDLKHEVYMVAFNPRHRWFYFPGMETNEVLLIKGFDSMKDGRARFTAHAAFEDPAASSSAPGRESIEARALVFYG